MAQFYLSSLFFYILVSIKETITHQIIKNLFNTTPIDHLLY